MDSSSLVSIIISFVLGLVVSYAAWVIRYRLRPASVEHGTATVPAVITAQPTENGTKQLEAEKTLRRHAEEKLRQRNEYLAAFHETTLALINRLDPKELLEAILLRAMALVDTQHGLLYLPEPGNRALSAQVCHGLFGAFENLRLLPDDKEGASGQAWLTGQVVVVDDYQTWPNRASALEPTPIQSAIAVPIKSDKQVVGVICLAHQEVGRLFGADEVEILSWLAELGSIALDNAQLYTSAQQELLERKRVEDELRQINVELDKNVLARTAELQQEQKRLQALLDDMGEGVIYSRQLQILYTNRALAELTQYQISELVGQSVAILKCGTDSSEVLRQLAAEPAERGVTWRGEANLCRKDGTVFNAALVMTRIAEPDRQSTGTVTIVRDITEEKQLQTQKSRFMANASHELRTPLTNIKTRIYLLRKQPAKLGEHIDALERATDHMISLVEDLLDMSRFERGVVRLERRNVTIQNLIETVVQLQQPEATQKGILLTTDLPVDPIQIWVDSTRIMQVIINLVGNAINYTPSEGQVCVRLHRVKESDKEYVQLDVQDTGIGIAPDNLIRVFEPFFRINDGLNRGVGLGLSITKEIVGLHHGTLTVESELGKGSTFSVCLALNEQQAEQQEVTQR